MDFVRELGALFASELVPLCTDAVNSLSTRGVFDKVRPDVRPIVESLAGRIHQDGGSALLVLAQKVAPLFAQKVPSAVTKPVNAVLNPIGYTLIGAIGHLLYLAIRRFQTSSEYLPSFLKKLFEYAEKKPKDVSEAELKATVTGFVSGLFAVDGNETWLLSALNRLPSMFLHNKMYEWTQLALSYIRPFLHSFPKPLELYLKARLGEDVVAIVENLTSTEPGKPIGPIAVFLRQMAKDTNLLGNICIPLLEGYLETQFSEVEKAAIKKILLQASKTILADGREELILQKVKELILILLAGLQSQPRAFKEIFSEFKKGPPPDFQALSDIIVRLSFGESEGEFLDASSEEEPDFVLYSRRQIFEAKDCSHELAEKMQGYCPELSTQYCQGFAQRLLALRPAPLDELTQKDLVDALMNPWLDDIVHEKSTPDISSFLDSEEIQRELVQAHQERNKAQYLDAVGQLKTRWKERIRARHGAALARLVSENRYEDIPEKYRKHFRDAVAKKLPQADQKLSILDDFDPSISVPYARFARACVKKMQIWVENDTSFDIWAAPLRNAMPPMPAGVDAEAFLREFFHAQQSEDGTRCVRNFHHRFLMAHGQTDACSRHFCEEYFKEPAYLRMRRELIAEFEAAVTFERARGADRLEMFGQNKEAVYKSLKGSWLPLILERVYTQYLAPALVEGDGQELSEKGGATANVLGDIVANWVLNPQNLGWILESSLGVTKGSKQMAERLLSHLEIRELQTFISRLVEGVLQRALHAFQQKLGTFQSDFFIPVITETLGNVVGDLKSEKTLRHTLGDPRRDTEIGIKERSDCTYADPHKRTAMELTVTDPEQRTPEALHVLIDEQERRVRSKADVYRKWAEQMIAHKVSAGTVDADEQPMRRAFALHPVFCDGDRPLDPQNSNDVAIIEAKKKAHVLENWLRPVLYPLLFPNGKKDLAPLPENLQELVYDLLTQSVLPGIFVGIVNSLGNEAQLGAIITNAAIALFPDPVVAAAYRQDAEVREEDHAARVPAIDHTREESAVLGYLALYIAKSIPSLQTMVGASEQIFATLAERGEGKDLQERLGAKIASGVNNAFAKGFTDEEGELEPQKLIDALLGLLNPILEAHRDGRFGQEVETGFTQEKAYKDRLELELSSHMTSFREFIWNTIVDGLRDVFNKLDNGTDVVIQMLPGKTSQVASVIKEVIVWVVAFFFGMIWDLVLGVGWILRQPFDYFKIPTPAAYVNEKIQKRKEETRLNDAKRALAVTEHPLVQHMIWNALDGLFLSLAQNSAPSVR